LREILEKIDAHIDVLSRARFNYLSKEAERKHFEARLIASAKGKSHAERVVGAQASEEWRKFQVDLAKLESVYHFELLKHEVLDKEFLAQHLTLKIDNSTIKRLGSV